MSLSIGIGRYIQLLIIRKPSKSSFKVLMNNSFTVFCNSDELQFQHDDYAKNLKFSDVLSDRLIQTKIAIDITPHSKTTLLANISDKKEEKIFSAHYRKKSDFYKTAFENRHLLPNWLNGAFLGYPASETCFIEPGRGEKGISKSGNDSKAGPVPRVTDKRSERAKSITLPPIIRISVAAKGGSSPGA